MNFQIHVLPDPVNFFLQLLATLILFFVLRHFLYKPVSEFLNKRKETIKSDLESAENKRAEAIKLKEEYEAKVEEAKGEGKEIIETSRRRGEDLRNEIIEEAKNEAQSIREKSKSDIEREKQKAQMELKGEMVTIAMLAASKVVDKNLDEKSHKDMIDKFIDEVGESQWQS
ncbi:F0F1 ATP synthase subunit B [Clostridium sp. D2Q-14]|uniref:F0F1 ATP synthase subunit B n=1 Tax=Anaeromonas gelatinilytica TaxID=2683194 RepID=UPI00193C61C8|nr:F0F1 ATP synthase subunit B [Anaeromonas gelatinilytica]MBS4536443.1 F0F1 ATP synthase subunit B [Anaeromonas gelatinilytica]